MLRPFKTVMKQGPLAKELAYKMAYLEATVKQLGTIEDASQIAHQQAQTCELTGQTRAHWAEMANATSYSWWIRIQNT
jgi:hypothetical protein